MISTLLSDSEAMRDTLDILAKEIAVLRNSLSEKICQDALCHSANKPLEKLD